MSGRRVFPDLYPEETCAKIGHDLLKIESTSGQQSWEIEYKCRRCGEIQTYKTVETDTISSASSIPVIEIAGLETLEEGLSVPFEKKSVPEFLGLPYASQLLLNASNLYAERNAVYKDNFRMVGKIMEAMFPGSRPNLNSAADYNRWHLFELAIVKLTRYATAFNEGGHADSLDDMIVYLAMVAALDAENGHRS